MKIVRIYGGLGNQMFQYALAVSLRNNCPEEDIYIDHSVMRGYPLHNGYQLDSIFNITIPQAPLFKIASVGWPLPHYRLWQIGNRFLPVRHSHLKENGGDPFNKSVFHKKDMLIDGYWQSPKYFEHCEKDIREAFTFGKFKEESENAKLLVSLRNKISISIHVRRGDYINIASTTGICTLDYYKRAICRIKNTVSPDLFVVFSDDQDWCRKNLSDVIENDSVLYVDWNHGKESFRDMQLMSNCTHNIIANSSFSWWGAWLNKNSEKIVVAPSRWFIGGGWDDLIPDTWIRI